MKILIVNDYQPLIGGAEMYIHRISKYLQEQGHEVEFFTSEVDAQTYNRYLYSPPLIVHLRRIFSLHYWWKMHQKVRTSKPDIIHMHGILQELTPSVLLAAGRIPIVMTVHDLQMVQAVSRPRERNGKPCLHHICPGCTNCVGWKGMVYEKIKRTIHAYLWHRVSLFICPSAFTREKISRIVPLSKSIHLANGIPLLKPSPLVNGKNLLYIGRLSKDKGLRMLIEMFTLIADRDPEHRLYIAGSGPDKEYLQQLIRKSKHKKLIKLLGKVSYDQVTDLYHQSSVVIVPSDYPDNLPTVCMEAMSAGRSVIATKVGGIPEMVIDGKTGYLVEQDDDRNAAEKVVSLTSNKKRLQQFSHNAGIHAQKFDLSIHMKKLEEVYNQIVANSF